MAADARSLRHIVLAASAGNALEYYDFTVFGYFAQPIAATFFPHRDPATGLLLTFGTYGVSFLARPFGAAVLGAYGDRRGRRACLTVTIALMTLGTLLMAAMPGYGLIGRWAAMGVLLARLIQGFSAGGEFGSATAFVIEHAGRRPGFFGSFQFTSQAVSAILGSGVAWLVSAGLTPGQVGDWGFRLPFVLGLLIGPVGWYLRAHLEETPVFAAAVPGRPTDDLRRRSGSVALAACVVAAGTAGTYLTIYLPTYMQAHLHMAARASFGITFAASFAPLVVTPLAAAVSDRIGLIRVMIWCVAALALAAYPAVLLVATFPQVWVLMAVFVGLNVLRAAYTAPSAALLAALFPVSVRAAGMSMGYTLGVVVFGGFAQLTMEWLIDRTGLLGVPGLYLCVASLVSLWALVVIGRSKPGALPLDPAGECFSRPAVR